MLKITNFQLFGDRHLKGEKRIFRKFHLLGQFSANNFSMMPEMVKNDFSTLVGMYVSCMFSALWA